MAVDLSKLLTTSRSPYNKQIIDNFQKIEEGFDHIFLQPEIHLGTRCPGAATFSKSACMYETFNDFGFE